MEKPTRTVETLFDRNDFNTLAAVLRRSVYEKHGGFLPVLVHVNDLEMWVRAIAAEGGLMINEPLAAYRMFEGNDTNRLWRTGETFRDWLRLAAIWDCRYPTFDRAEFEQKVAIWASTRAYVFRVANQPEAAAACEKIWEELTPLSKRVLKRAKSTIRRFANVGS